MEMAAEPPRWLRTRDAVCGEQLQVQDQGGPPNDAVTKVAEQLIREFGLLLSLDTVTACVRDAQHDLDRLALDHAPPTLLDRLARARLLDALGLRQNPPKATHPAPDR